MEKKAKGIVTIYSKKTKRVDGSTREVPALKIATKELAEMGHITGDQFKINIEKDRIVFTKIISL